MDLGLMRKLLARYGCLSATLEPRSVIKAVAIDCSRVFRLPWNTPLKLCISGIADPVYVRPGSSDLTVVLETFGKGYDFIPAHLPDDKDLRIWDLGANIGLLSLQYASRFPRARISAVELDPNNSSIAEKNLTPFLNRCNIITGAVWVSDGEISYSVSKGKEYGARVSCAGELLRKSRSLSLNTLLNVDDAVDFMKMDIEGAEQEVLKTNTEWSEKVMCISVECHGQYHVTNAAADLARLGFYTKILPSHWSAVVGCRDKNLLM